MRAASRSSSGSARPARCRSSSSPRAATRSTASSASSSAPTTTSPSRSRRASWWRGCAACCAAPARARRGRAARRRQRRRSAAPAPPIAVDEGRMQIRYHGRLLELSRYEYGLLKTLASRPGHVFSRDALLERVWGNDTESMDRTVDAHVKTVRAKMKAIAPDEEPIRTHRGSGYSLAEDLAPRPSTERSDPDEHRLFTLDAPLLLSSLADAGADAAPARPTRRADRRRAVADRRRDHPSSRAAMATGSRLDRNERAIATRSTTPTFDVAAAGGRRARRSRRRMPGGRAPAGVDPRQAPVRAAGAGCSSPGRRATACAQALAGPARSKPQATHLVLVTKRRDDGVVQDWRDAHIGDGTDRRHRLLPRHRRPGWYDRRSRQSRQRLSSPATPT